MPDDGWIIYESSGIPGSKLKGIDPRKRGMSISAWRAMKINLLFLEKGQGEKEGTIKPETVIHGEYLKV